MLQSKKNFKTQILEIFIIHKHFLGPREVHTKFGAVRFSRFDVFWIQTNKQTPTQAKFKDYDVILHFSGGKSNFN